jgi:hypothetical protein
MSTSSRLEELEAGAAMIFYGFLLIVVLGIAWWAIRSPVVRQFRRGHGSVRPPFSSSNDHAFEHNGQTPTIDPLGQPKSREWE